MIEQQLEERFRLAVADEPPLGFDPDDIVDRASRRQRNRRAVAAAVAVVAVVTTATTIAFAAGQEDAPVAGRQAHPPVTCPSADQDIGWVDQRVREALTEHLERTEFASGTGPVVSGKISSETCGVYLNYKPRDVAPEHGVWVTLTYTTPPGDADTFAHDSRYKGTRKRLSDGSELRTYRRLADLGNQAPAQDAAAAVHVRPNGMTVGVRTTDLDTASMAELTALATDPDLTF